LLDCYTYSRFLKGESAMLRKLLAVPTTAALLAFGSAAHAEIWEWSFTDMGVDYSLTFDSLSGDGKVGTYTLTLDTSGYDKHSDPAYLDSVDIKAWDGTNTSFSLLSAPGGTLAWGPTEGAISSGPAGNTGCQGTESGFSCVEAIKKGAVNVDNGPYTFSFAVTADSFYMTSAGTHVGAGYADAYGAGAGYGITSVVAPIPEPETYAMLLAGLCLIFFIARRGRGRPYLPAAYA
jgi:hypothetical protein